VVKPPVWSPPWILRSGQSRNELVVAKAEGVENPRCDELLRSGSSVGTELRFDMQANRLSTKDRKDCDWVYATGN
jgi:hypothetical protein